MYNLTHYPVSSSSTCTSVYPSNNSSNSCCLLPCPIRIRSNLILFLPISQYLRASSSLFKLTVRHLELLLASPIAVLGLVAVVPSQMHHSCRLAVPTSTFPFRPPPPLTFPSSLCHPSSSLHKSTTFHPLAQLSIHILPHPLLVVGASPSVVFPKEKCVSSRGSSLYIRPHSLRRRAQQAGSVVTHNASVSLARIPSHITAVCLPFISLSSNNGCSLSLADNHWALSDGDLDSNTEARQRLGVSRRACVTHYIYGMQRLIGQHDDVIIDKLCVLAS
ncbi:hypothetical protein BDD12DRAFT_228734 [Trichophaea hybrida]|nr:hypothetical protein BDD12DRAFT_228734 [Trichophaea hybrida]